NLPTKNVVIDGRKWKYLPRYGRYSLIDVSKSEYENMSGRAGRLTFANEFGRSILVTSSPFEADVWMRHYVDADFEAVLPTLKDAPLENHVLNLLTSGLAHSRAELEQLLRASYTGFVHWNQAMTADEFTSAVERAIAICVHGALVRELAEGE